jgi:phage I-like protein
MSATTRFRQLQALPTEPEKQLWIHILPIGEFKSDLNLPAGIVVDGYGKFTEAATVPGTTVFNKQTLDRVLQTFDESRDMLIDYEHFSHHSDKATEAAGWGHNLRNTPSGLEINVNWAAPARQQITDSVYRYISPELTGDVKYEAGEFKFYPTALTGAGLTNRPKLTALNPITANRELSPPSTIMNYKEEIIKLLKLAPTATDEEITAALATEKTEPAEAAESAMTQNREMATELKQLKAEAIEQDLARFAPIIADKESTKQLLQLNRAATVKMLEAQLAALPGTEESKRVFIKNRATAPDGTAHFATEKSDEAANAKFRAVESRAHAIARERGITFSVAFDSAKAELGA